MVSVGEIWWYMGVSTVSVYMKYVTEVRGVVDLKW